MGQVDGKDDGSVGRDLRSGQEDHLGLIATHLDVVGNEVGPQAHGGVSKALEVDLGVVGLNKPRSAFPGKEAADARLSSCKSDVQAGGKATHGSSSSEDATARLPKQSSSPTILTAASQVSLSLSNSKKRRLMNARTVCVRVSLASCNSRTTGALSGDVYRLYAWFIGHLVSLDL